MSLLRTPRRESNTDSAALSPAFYLVGGFVAVSLVAAVLGAGLVWSAVAGAIGGALALYGSRG